MPEKEDVVRKNSAFVVENHSHRRAWGTELIQTSAARALARLELTTRISGEQYGWTKVSKIAQTRCVTEE